MIYISRLLPDIKNTQARRELANPYEMHRTLARAFPEGNEWADARLLFRVEQNGRIDDVAVLAQSRYLPDWSFLNNMNYLRKEVEIKRVEHINAPVGGRFCFRLRANPTLCRECKRHALRDESDQIEWLKRKGLQHGFNVLRVRISLDGNEKLSRAGNSQGSLFGVRFDGVLRVDNSEAFALAVETGIGSAKAFGFGLLSLGRAPSTTTAL